MRHIEFKHNESFRGNFRYTNSNEAVLRFPFPFVEDNYMYSVNVEPHVRGGSSAAFHSVFDVDEHYVAECRDKAITLAADPLRCQVLPHMEAAQWDTLELLMESLSSDYPDLFSLKRNASQWSWVNKILGISQEFVFGDRTTLPCPPFEYISRQAQGDFCLLDQRNDNLYMDGGMVTSQADWSLDFDLGMSFMEWHGPVPLAHEAGVFDRALRFLLALQQNKPVRRLNWTMTVNPRLDTSPETYPNWGPDRTSLTAENIGGKLFLRVELQTLFRLPRSNGILFGVRCYLLSLEDIVRVPNWARRAHRVLRSLPSELVDYKGLTRYRDLAVSWLSKYDDGSATTPGTAAGLMELT